MSNHGKQGDQADDRTILDPLNADELRALREARARMAQGGSGVGPDTGDDIGDAATRATPAIPRLDAGPANLSNMGGGIMPKPQPLTPETARVSAQQGGPTPIGPNAQGPGFGENTLMWMAPVRAPEKAPVVIPERGAAAAGGMAPTAVPQETAGRKILVVGLVVAAVFAVGAALWTFTGGGGAGIVEITTTPPQATVVVDGKKLDFPTPMKATIPAGTHKVQISKEGYRTETEELTVVNMEELHRDYDLFPLSEGGKLTVSIKVQPVTANIAIDDVEFPSRKVVHEPNVDPSKKHKITVTAGGYKKIEQEVPAGQLKESYNFVLEKEDPAGSN